MRKEIDIEKRYKGKILFVDQKFKTGYIRPYGEERLPDVRFEMTQLAGWKDQRIKEGDKVTFEVFKHKKILRAKNLRRKEDE